MNLPRCYHCGSALVDAHCEACGEYYSQHETGPAPKEEIMSRRDDVEAWIEDIDSYNETSARRHANNGLLTLAAEVDQRDATITALLEMLRPEKHRPSWEHEAYARALEIAGRTE